MVERVTSFRDFEHQGWSSEDVALGYHDYLFQDYDAGDRGRSLERPELGGKARRCRRATGGLGHAAAGRARGGEGAGDSHRHRLFRNTGRACPAALSVPRVPRTGDAGSLPFPDRTLAVLSAISACPLLSADAFISEAFDAGRAADLAFSVWASPEESFGLGIIYGAVQSHGRMDVPAARPQLFLFERSGPVRAKPPRGGFPAGHCVQGPAGLADGIAGRAVRGDHEGRTAGPRSFHIYDVRPAQGDGRVPHDASRSSRA